MEDRDEHLKWCKTRALEILDRDHNRVEALTSMMSDLDKHEGTKPGPGIATLFIFECMQGDDASARRFIEGFR